MYRPYSSPDSYLRKSQPEKYRKICEIVDNFTPAQAEEFLGLEFPYNYIEMKDAIKKKFPNYFTDEEEHTWYWGLNDVLRMGGEPWEHVDDEEWIAARYGEYSTEDYDEDENDEENSFIDFIETLTYRKHDTGSELGHVYDTGIRGTLGNPSDTDREEFLRALAQHGPYAFILDEDDIYNIACVDTMYHLFQGIWNGLAFADAVTSQRREIDRSGFGHWEYNVANTIAIMRDFDFTDGEITVFLRGNETDYNCEYYFVNEYLRSNGDKRYFDDPFE